MRVWPAASLLLWLTPFVPALAEDWPTANHDARRSGYTTDFPPPPYTIRWVHALGPGEGLTTRVEPVVYAGRVFVGTYGGRLHALDADRGAARWVRTLDGPVLHSVACASGLVFTATAAGTVYALSAASGTVRWARHTGPGGFDTAPLVAGGLVMLGSRGGAFWALDMRTGRARWRRDVGAPIRTTASSDGRAVFFAAEDMRARACDLRTGRALWVSDRIEGQSLRDYYPVVVGSRLVLRSNPAGPFAERLAADRHLLAANAGVDDSDWRSLDAFVKSDRTDGSAEQIRREQDAILAHLGRTPDARTFHVLDCRTGRRAARAPVLYAAGCQGVGTPPVVTGAGSPIVLWRSAYSNWTLGVAPLVGIGYLDVATGRIDPIRHTSGAQPPWNTFWGTADETTHLTVGGGTLFLCHQGTLAGLDLATRRLFTIAGARDTWGGYAGLPWARNEWHGPARGAAAIAGSRLYWATGSRVIAVQGAAPAISALPEPASGPGPMATVPPAAGRLPTASALERYVRGAAGLPARFRAGFTARPTSALVALRAGLVTGVKQVLAGPWKPLCVQPGLAGREFCFAHSSEAFEALTLAYPLLSPALRGRVRAYLRDQWRGFPPYGKAGWYPLAAGRAREWFAVPAALRAWPDRPQDPPAIAWLYSVWRYADELDAWDAVRAAWPEMRRAFEATRAGRWPPAVEQVGLWDNRVVSGLIGYARMARRMGDPTGAEASRMAGEGLRVLVQRARSFDARDAMPPQGGVADLDRFIGAGNGLFLAIRPHKARMARLYGWSPEVAACLREHAAPQVRALFQTIDATMPGWYLAGEERQVHFGENFVDYPDQALHVFMARLYSGLDGRGPLTRWIDIPGCAADLYDISRRAALLRSLAARQPAGAPIGARAKERESDER